MNIRDFHIEINQSVQKVAANTTRKYLSEELDWVINKMQDRFVQNKLQPMVKERGPKQSVDQLNVDALRNLIVSNKEVQAYVDTTTRVKCILPSNYMYLLSDSSYIISNCRTASTTSTLPVSVHKLLASQTTKASAPYYVTSEMVIGTDTISIPGSLPLTNAHTGYIKKGDISELISFYLSRFRQLGYEVYWERYDTTYAPNTFLIISSSSTITLSHDSVPVTDLTTQSLTYTQYNEVVTPKFTYNRLEASENVQALLTTAFYTTSAMTPISELVGTNLYVYHDTSFTVRKCSISYVRKPQRVSLSLGSDCEVAEQFHQIICDMCTEYIKGRIEDGTGEQLIRQDNDTRVKL